MSDLQTRIRIENEILGRLERRYTEEEQANHLMNTLMESYPLLSATTLSSDLAGGKPTVFAHRGLSNHFIKSMYSRGATALVENALRETVEITAKDPRAKDPGFRLEHEYETLYAVPCRYQEEVVGVFVVDSMHANLLTPENREAFQAYSRLLGLLITVRNLRGRISRIPEIDSVTGLHDFKFFHEALHRELSRGKKFGHPVTVLFVKIRNLRQMNDVHGHLAADQALATIAERVRACMREVDYVSRAGATVHIVMPQSPKADGARAAAKMVEAMNAAPVSRGDISLQLAVGVAAFPKDGDSERVLIPHVESMVHEAVRKGGNAFSVYKD